MPFGNVGSMRGDLIRNDALFDIVSVRESKVLLGGDITKHRSSHPTNHGRANGGCDVIVTRSNIDGQGAKCIKRSFVTML